MKRMNLQYIKYALAIKKYGSITKASKELFVSQPNMSNAIKKLESDLNIQIFTRSSSGSILTYNGIQFLNEVEPLITELENISNKYANTDTNQTLSISSLPSSMFESVILNIMKKHKTNINLVQRSFSDVIDSVFTDLTNIGFLYFPTELDAYIYNILKSKSLDYKEIMIHPFYILTSIDNDLDKSNCNINYLSNYTCVFYEGLCNEYILDSSNVIRNFINEIPTQKLIVSDRTSEYLTLTSLPKTISLSTKLPENILNMYKLKQLPLDAYSVKYIYIYKKNRHIPSVIKAISKNIISNF